MISKRVQRMMFIAIALILLQGAIGEISSYITIKQLGDLEELNASASALNELRVDVITSSSISVEQAEINRTTIENGIRVAEKFEDDAMQAKMQRVSEAFEHYMTSHDQSSGEAMLTDLSELVTYSNTAYETIHEEMMAGILWKNQITIAIIIVFLLIMWLWGRRLVRVIVKKIDDQKILIETFANGEINQALPDNDTSEFRTIIDAIRTASHSISDIINGINQNLYHTKSEMKALSEDLNDEQEQMTQLMDGYARNVMQLVQNIEQINRTTNEIASGATEIAASATKSADASGEALANSSESKIKVDEMAGALEMAQKEVLTIDSSVTSLSKAFDEIVDLVGAIKGVSSQINLLALNAAIEAARAGEAGRGFAVVSEEIRKLSDETDQLTENIEKVTQTMVARIGDVSENVAKAGEEAAHGVSLAESTTLLIDQSLVSVTKLSESIRDIAAITQEQAAGTEEIAATIDVTSQTANQMSADSEVLGSNFAKVLEKSKDASKSVGKNLDEIRRRMQYFKI
ncbi:methyl-accepting chemotaxis protein [Fusibacter paucivorans]|uniref:Methyl-accepting chemotaxis protein n=1 Tax=Fusibacter paucivorans TaxID=76009 RepID=A0ABS5PR27_9FIRM|nr:methyl-accepting chemotaxis protein [Fusibacter paucivorans]MBS7527508.1 methyl-accepting chemotaxis protein [Fusibacter paucivorans]